MILTIKEYAKTVIEINQERIMLLSRQERHSKELFTTCKRKYSDDHQHVESVNTVNNKKIKEGNIK